MFTPMRGLAFLGVVFLLLGSEEATDFSTSPADTSLEADSTAATDTVTVESMESVADSSVTKGLSCPGRPDSLVNRAFGLGERLVFKIKYAGITAGISTIEVADTVRLDGHLCYRIDNRTQSSKTFSVFYKVDDRTSAWMDVEEFVSRGFEKHLREGDYKKDTEVWFDQEHQIARYPLKDEQVEVPPCVMDVFSALFYVRLLPLDVGMEVEFDNHDNKKTYPLVVKVLKRELIKVEAGAFRCLKVQPLLRTPGLFKHEGKLWVWLTDDASHMPVLMKSKVAVGSVNAELAEFSRGKLLHDG